MAEKLMQNERGLAITIEKAQFIRLCHNLDNAGTVQFDLGHGTAGLFCWPG